MDLNSIETITFDKKIFREYPQPIAAAWSRVFAAKDETARLSQAHISFFEVLARTLVTYLLPDYLRGPADEQVEKKLAKGIDKAALGTWWTLIRDLIRANEHRTDVFFMHAYPWYFNTGGKPSSAARLIEDLVASRNNIAHGIQPLSSTAIRHQLSENLSKYRELLRSLNWLTGYPLFHADIRSETSGGIKHGVVQIYRGNQQRAPYEEARWRAVLTSDALYVHNPENGVLMISPLAAVLEENPTIGPRLHTFARTEKSGRIILEDDDGEDVPAQLEGQDVTLPRILEDRRNYAWFQPNHPEGALRTGGLPRESMYEVKELLGRGGIGAVYRVWDPALKRERALKILRPNASASEELRERFFQEARRVGREEHEHILTVDTHMDVDVGPYLVMDLMPGSLASAIAAPGLSERQLLLIAEQVLEALAHLHEHGVTHRDVKPSNILLTTSGTAVLADFGLATDEEDDFVTRLVSTLEKHTYMAPEQQRGRLTAKSDVYSLARVLHDLKVGKTTDTSPGSELEGWVGELLRAMGDSIPEKRLDSRKALEMIRAKLGRHVPTVAMGHPEIPPAREFGRTLRTLLESGAKLPEHLEEHLRHHRTATGGLDARQLWYSLRARHLRVAWPHLVGTITVGDVLSARGVRFSARHIHSAIAHLPLEPRQRAILDGTSAIAKGESLWAMYSEIPAAALGVRKFVDCLGYPRSVPIEEERFVEEALRFLSIGTEDNSSLDALWNAVQLALPEPRYRRGSLRKRNGRQRWIHLPAPGLARIQRLVARILGEYIPGDSASTGFVPQRSTALNARYHEGAAAAVIVDIHDFFGSIVSPQILSALHSVVSSPRWKHPFKDWSDVGREALVDILVTSHPSRHYDFLPQGAPSSPAVANLVASSLDATINRTIAHLHGASDWRYSRYADDLVISSLSGGHSFHQRAQQVLLSAAKRMSWHVSRSKIRHWSSLRGGPLVLCGIHVPARRGAPLELPRDTKRRIRAALHAARKGVITPEVRGILGYGYAVTGRHVLTAALPGTVQRAVRELARTLCPVAVDDFVEGWMAE